MVKFQFIFFSSVISFMLSILSCKIYSFFIKQTNDECIENKRDLANSEKNGETNESNHKNIYMSCFTCTAGVRNYSSHSPPVAPHPKNWTFSLCKKTAWSKDQPKTQKPVFELLTFNLLYTIVLFKRRCTLANWHIHTCWSNKYTHHLKAQKKFW